MRLVYEVERADLESFLPHYHEHAAATAGLRTLARAVLPGVVAVAFCIVGIIQGAWILPVMGVLLGLALRAALPGLMRLSVRASIDRSLAQGAGASWLGQHELELSQDGLVDRAGGEEFLHPWEELTDIVIVPERAYVYLGPRRAYVIPLRGVREGDYQGFVRQLQKRLAAGPERAKT